MASYAEQVGERLRNIRLQKGLSLHDVEERSAPYMDDLGHAGMLVKHRRNGRVEATHDPRSDGGAACRRTALVRPLARQDALSGIGHCFGNQRAKLGRARNHRARRRCSQEGNDHGAHPTTASHGLAGVFASSTTACAAMQSLGRFLMTSRRWTGRRTFRGCTTSGKECCSVRAPSRATPSPCTERWRRGHRVQGRCWCFWRSHRLRTARSTG